MKKIILLIFIFTLCISNAKESTILFLGDSLTEGLGVDKQEAYPALVEEMFQKRVKKDIKIINGGVSGSTTSDGLERLKWYMKKRPDFVFVALGANDGLRGLDLNQTQKNLEEIIKFIKNSNSKPLLAGMLIPPNYGPKYSLDFENIFKNIKEKYNIKTMPFLLIDVAGVKNLNQSDGIHPNVEGHKIIAQNVFDFLIDALKEEL